MTQQRTRPICPRRLEDEEDYHAFILYNSKDSTFGKVLCRHLGKDGFKIADQQNTCETIFPKGSPADELTEKCMSAAQRIVMVVSKAFLTGQYTRMVERMANHQTKLYREERRLWVLIDGVKREDLPKDVQEAPVVVWKGEASNDDSKLELEKEMCQEVVSMTQTLGAANTGYGLAWSYFYGYLNLILPSLETRIMKAPQWPKKVDDLRITPRLFIIMPKSCLCPPNIQSVDSRFKPAAGIEPCVMSRAGSINRKYTNQLYEISVEGEKPYYAVIEFATPLVTLYDMEEGGVASLSRTEKEAERRLFVRTLRDVLKLTKAQNPAFCMFHLLTVDDSGGKGDEMLYAAVVGALKKELRKDVLYYKLRYGDSFPTVTEKK